MSAPVGRRAGAAASALVGLVVVSAIAGLMITVGVAPAIALTGVTAKNGIGLFENLPSDLTITPLQQRSELFGVSHGKAKLITSLYEQNRIVDTWAEVGENARKAALGAEDTRFYHHGGVDPTGIVRAAVSNLSSGGISSGASTITQQYVKNVCEQQALTIKDRAKSNAAFFDCEGQTLSRKVREMRLAIGLEKKYSKDRILLGYLNIALFGGQVYGIEAAAQYYYGTHAKDLSVAQAASLLATVKSPNAYRIDIKANIPANQARRGYVLGQELKVGLITQAQYDTAMATPVKPKITRPKTGCQASGTAGYFCDYVQRQILANTPLGRAFGKTRDERATALFSGGVHIYTTLNLDLEKQAAATVKKYVPMKKTSYSDLGGAAVTVRPQTGDVVVMTQSKNFSTHKGSQNSVINYSTDEAYGGSGGFQPGSTYKLYTLLDWLQNGHGLDEIVNGTPVVYPAGSFTACGAPTGSYYKPTNDSAGEKGYKSVITSTADSINAAFISMAHRLDLCDINALATKLGFHRANGAKLQDNPSDIVGSGANNVSPLSEASAYATIAAKGLHCATRIVTSAVLSNGSKLRVPGPSCSQVIPSDLAVAAGTALHQVLMAGTAAGDGAGSAYEFGKTGTTDQANQTWLVAGSTAAMTAVWVGNVTGSTNLRQVFGWRGCGYQGNYRGEAALERHCIWHDLMAANEAATPGDTSWPAPDAHFLTGTLTPVPDVTGQSVSAAKQALEAAGFQAKVGTPVPSTVADGQVASTDPSAGTGASGGAMVTLHPSGGGDGQTGTVPDVTGQSPIDAKTAVQRAGFSAVAVVYDQGDGQCKATGTDPAAGTSAPFTTPVVVSVDGGLNARNGSFKCR